MKFKNEKEQNKAYRDCLCPDWQKLEFDKTDRGKKLPKPDVCKHYFGVPEFDLDVNVNKLSDKRLYDIVHSRRSIRKYQDVTMAKKELSYLCSLTCDITKYGPGYAFGVIPSGGATSSLETYLYLHKVEGFEQGIYHYAKDTSKLQLVRKNVTPDMVNKATGNQLRGAQVIFFWTTKPYRAEYKYSFTAHKMIAMEAGHACQNLYLAAESIDYGVVAIAAYHQKLSDKLLQVDKDEFVIYIGAVGKK